MAQVGISSFTKYTWIIKNFTKFSSKPTTLYSDVFLLGGYKWKLSANPGEGERDRCLALFVAVAYSPTLPEGWSIDLESFTVVNQKHSKDSFENCGITNRKFDAISHSFGFLILPSLEDLHDLAKGYLVDDTLVIEARLRVSSASFSNLLNKSKNLLAELSIMDITTSSSEISESILPPNPQSWQEHREALDEYLALSLETFRQAITFDEFEKIAFHLLKQHSLKSSDHPTALEILLLRLETFKEIVLLTTKPTIENAIDLRTSLLEKSADVGARLSEGEEQLGTLETNFTKLFEEEVELEAEILRLTNQKEELLTRMNSAAEELEKVNDQVSKDLGKWRDIIKETEVADRNWRESKEKLAQASLNFKQNLKRLCDTCYNNSMSN